MMLHPAKKIWDILKITYGHKKNIFRVFEVYEQIFSLRQGDRSLQEYFTTLHGLIDELDIYQPLTADITKMRQYWEELAVTAYLSSLNPELSSYIRGQILDAEALLDLQNTISRVLRISTVTLAPVTD